jgi:hypothetical protein
MEIGDARLSDPDLGDGEATWLRPQLCLFPPSPIKPIWVRTTKADTLRRRRDGPSLIRLSTCSSFLATRVLDGRNRPNENRFRFPNRLPYKRSCSVSAAERCGRTNSTDGGC